jgi:hypothetical protein
MASKFTGLVWMIKELIEKWAEASLQGDFASA